MKETDQKALNDVSKLVVPLLDDNIDPDDLSLESGFINAYTDDINRPYFDNHIFLMYDSNIATVKSMNRFRKFKALGTLFTSRYVTINKKHYIIYVFSRVPKGNELKNVLNGSGCISAAAKLSIYNFWKDVPFESYSHEIFLPHFRFCKPVQAELPEEDYYPYEQEKPDSN